MFLSHFIELGISLGVFILDILGESTKIYEFLHNSSFNPDRNKLTGTKQTQSFDISLL